MRPRDTNNPQLNGDVFTFTALELFKTEIREERSHQLYKAAVTPDQGTTPKMPREESEGDWVLTANAWQIWFVRVRAVLSLEAWRHFGKTKDFANNLAKDITYCHGQ